MYGLHWNKSNEIKSNIEDFYFLSVSVLAGQTRLKENVAPVFFMYVVRLLDKQLD